MADLIARGTLTPELAAALWYAIDLGASVFVAAGPSGAGKSTLAHALLEFLPKDANAYVTSGARDPLDLPATDEPTYLLVNELSCHMPIYLYGPAAHHAFGLLNTRTRILGTLHARSAVQAVAVMCDEAYLTRSDLATPFVLAVVTAMRASTGVVRRVTEVGFLPPSGDVQSLTRHGSEGIELHNPGLGALATWAATPSGATHAEITRRAALLGGPHVGRAARADPLLNEPDLGR